MMGYDRRRGGWAARTNRSRWLVAVLLATALAGGCDYPFQPYRDTSSAPFSMFGYLDLRADTQWIRVMPVRQDLLADPAPIDAVVTLERLSTGRTVTLQDSLFQFADPELDAVGYAHNFWTTEPMEPGATYRLTAAHSDGDSTTALIKMPADVGVSVTYPNGPPVFAGTSRLGEPILEGREATGADVRAGYTLYGDKVYTVWDSEHDRPGAPVVIRQPVYRVDSLMETVRFQLGALRDRFLVDVQRREARIAAAPSDWPYSPGLSVTQIAVPGSIPSNVEHGFGFVGGLTTWTVPLPRCNAFDPRPDGRNGCTTVINASSASIVGKVVPKPCSTPQALAKLRLTERFAGGGYIVLLWKADWDGTYRFEGLEPGADLLLEFDDTAAPPVHVPPLAPGEQYEVPDVSLPIGC